MSGDRGDELPEQRRSREDRRLSLPATNGVASMTAALSRVADTHPPMRSHALSDANKKHAASVSPTS
ncbi:MAG: hypothetical protein ACJ72A_12790 [Nocardioidaceae bacterium]